MLLCRAVAGPDDSSASAGAAIARIGVPGIARGIVHPVHNEFFDVDEECLACGPQAATSVDRLLP